jgi:hypothetical protein
MYERRLTAVLQRFPGKCSSWVFTGVRTMRFEDVEVLPLDQFLSELPG